MQKSLAMMAALLLGLELGGAQAAVVADQPYTIDGNYRLHTDIFLNNQGPFNFLLDTAASMTFLARHVSSQLNLKPDASKPFTILGLSDLTQAHPAQVNSMRLSGATFRDMPVGVLPDLWKFPDGVLGIDALSHFTVVLDREAMRLKLMTQATASSAAFRNWASAELTPRELKDVNAHFWVTKANFGKERITALFNLGAGVTILNWKAAELLGIKQQEFKGQYPPNKRLRDILGRTAPAVNALMTVEIAGQRFRNHRVLIANTPIFEQFNMDGGPAAIIGPGLLRDHSVALDFEGKRLFIGPKVEDGATAQETARAD